MTKAKLFDTKGTLLKTVTLPSSVFSVEVNEKLLSQALHVYRTNQTQGTSKVKTRGEVNLTTAKVYRQKGTGNARHGAKSAPIFVGGGKAHGPKGLKAKNKKLNKKMRQSVIKSLLTQTAKAENLILVDKLNELKPKTKLAHNLFTKLKLNDRVLMLVNNPSEDLKKATANLDYLTLNRPELINVFTLIKAKSVIVDHESLSVFEKTFSKTK